MFSGYIPEEETPREQAVEEVRRTPRKLPNIWPDMRPKPPPKDIVTDDEHMALVYGQVDQEEDILVRVHSECMTGNTLGSLRCDCGPQYEASLHLIAEVRSGLEWADGGRTGTPYCRPAHV